jgi:FkbM family methyltransferase
MAAAQPQFGAFAPTAFQKALIGLFGLPVLRRGFFRRMASPLVAGLRAGPLDIERTGLRYRLSIADNVAEQGILFNPAYQQDSLAFVRQRLRSGATMIDCGANVGQYALVAAQIVGPLGTVLAVEASPAMAQRLSANVALSHLDDLITVAPVAVGEAEGALRFAIDERDGALSHASETGAHTVPMRPLLALAEDAGLTRIDLLKLDVEGMEERVLGAFFADAPERLWPAAMIVEDELSARWSGDLRGVLDRCGYRVVGRTKGNVFYEIPTMRQ